MLGDELVVKEEHTERAEEICEILTDSYTKRKKVVVTIAGESGSGKSELASEIARIKNGNDWKTGIIQQDDYFVFPPKTNHKMRQKNIDQVGTYEVKLDFLDSNLYSFKNGAETIYKPLVDYDRDEIKTEEMEVGQFNLLIAEGTYTTILNFADFRIFIDRDYRDTYSDRKQRGRDKFEPFVEDVLKREHEIISSHKKDSDLIITGDYQEIELKA